MDKITALEIIKRFLKKKKYVQMWQIEINCREFGINRFGVFHLPSTYKREFNSLLNKEGFHSVKEDGRGKKFKHKTWLIN